MNEGRDNRPIIVTICQKSEAPKDGAPSWHCDACNFWPTIKSYSIQLHEAIRSYEFCQYFDFLFSLSARTPALIQKEAFFQIGHDRRSNPGLDLVKI
jgi:hypothetical protein